MADLRYFVQYRLDVDEKEFKLIGKALAGKLDRADKRGALELLAKLMAVRETMLHEQTGQTQRIADEVARELSITDEQKQTP